MFKMKENDEMYMVYVSETNNNIIRGLNSEISQGRRFTAETPD